MVGRGSTTERAVLSGAAHLQQPQALAQPHSATAFTTLLTRAQHAGRADLAHSAQAEFAFVAVAWLVGAAPAAAQQPASLPQTFASAEAAHAWFLTAAGARATGQALQAAA